jgi:hypothetical protein
MVTTTRTLGRRMSRGVAAVVAVAALTGALAACGSPRQDVSPTVEVDTGDSNLTPSEVLAHASDSTAAVETGHMHFTYDYTFRKGGRTATATLEASGSFADHGAQSEVTADMTDYIRQIAGQSGAPTDGMPESMSMEAVQDGTRMYMKVDSVPSEPGTGEWYGIDYADLGMSTQALQQPAGFGGGVDGFVESLKGAGTDVTETGTEEIDGVSVTRFEGTIDPQAAIDKAAPDKRDQVRQMLGQIGITDPMPFVAWVDGDGVLRRMTQTVTMKMGGVSITMKMTVDLYDLGVPVTITPPPADQVHDMSELGLGTA